MNSFSCPAAIHRVIVQFSYKSRSLALYKKQRDITWLAWMCEISTKISCQLKE